MNYLLASAAQAANEVAKEASSSLIQIDWRTLLFAILNLSLLFIVLWTFLYKPVKKMMEDRKKAASSVIDDAKKLQEEAKSSLENAKKQKSDAAEESRKITSESVQTAEAIREEIIGKAREDAKSIIRIAEEEAKGEREITEQDLKSRSKKIIVQASRQVMKQVFDNGMTGAYTKHIISELPKLTVCDIHSHKLNLCDALSQAGKVSRIVIESATEMSEVDKKAVSDFVLGFVKNGAKVEFIIKPELISGLRIVFGDTIFDSSISRMVETTIEDLR
ncbi:MAG TPA: F0F1 ATP synthase subunit delta [Caldisericia bacterium]|jgi:F-type H+-transporting ATPase subunit b|nr:F0F1 ATP synthase subunit delta [Caldisericia bacterium]HNY60779.1 F0F1 ATP synthase subunit delta [Caldisericia bacterium]HOC79020.1 F0F1 ATP synthase subunit delta [Caldisericia bacterium]HOG69820.1 F0F1 ATP synthase subunit delta [Caldisericia bacterium]HPA65305.1 F0F1 ATP synthase subunit delta [Caldisericia bacterium]